MLCRGVLIARGKHVRKTVSFRINWAQGKNYSMWEALTQCFTEQSRARVLVLLPNRNGGMSLVPSPVLVSGLTLGFLQAEKNAQDPLSPCHIAGISLPAASGAPSDAGQQRATWKRKKKEN